MSRTGRPPEDPDIRFARFLAPAANGCVIWQGTKDRAGYGSFSLPGKRRIKAHRWAYERARGPIPDGLQIDHLCRNTSCVNPDHLEPVTPRENTLRSDNITSRYAHATHCARGHRLEQVGNRRRCRVCQRETWRRYRARKRVTREAVA